MVVVPTPGQRIGVKYNKINSTKKCNYKLHAIYSRQYWHADFRVVSQTLADHHAYKPLLQNIDEDFNSQFQTFSIFYHKI